MTPEEIEKVDLECEKDLKEIKLWYGDWSDLRKVIDRLEDNENEAAYERWSNDYDSTSNAETSERMHKIQNTIK